MGTSPCPPPEQLAAFDSGALAPAEIEAVAAHLEAGCVACEAALAAGETRLPDEAAAALRRRPGDPPEAGDVVGGRYRLVEPLGEGGMGSVWLARQDEPVRRAVAVKLVRHGMATREVLARFEAERQALALMDHPNIARVFDAGSADGKPFFVMELVRGVPVTTFCDERKLSVRERLALFVTVCEAVAHAHTKGIIHRDIKPANVLVTVCDDRPQVKVIDFGIAKAAGLPLTDLTLMTGLGAVVGTPEYMSPEQAASGAGGIDTRSDVYALGVLLYELLTGTTPLPRGAANLVELMRLVCEHEPQRPSSRVLATSAAQPGVAAARGSEPRKLAGELGGELDWIVLRAMEKDRARRYQSAADLGADVGRYLGGEPVRAAPPSAAYRVRKFVRRHRGAVVAAALVLLALVAGVIGTTTMYVRAEAARQATAEELEKTKRANELLDRQKWGSGGVAYFLQDDVLALAADPSVSVREALDRAGERLDGPRPLHPLADIAVRYALGNACMRSGQPGKAAHHFDRAQELMQTDPEYGPGNRETIHMLHKLAEAYLEDARPELALAVGRRAEVVALAHHERTARGYQSVLSVKNDVGLALRSLGRLDEATRQYETSLDWAGERFGPEDDDGGTTWVLMLNLADAHGAAGRLAEARRLLRECLRRTGGDEFLASLAQSALGRLELQSGDPAAAEPLLSQSLAIRRRLQPQHWATSHAASLLGQALLDGKKLPEAEPLLVEGYEGMKRQRTAIPPRSLPRLAEAAGRLADLYAAQGNQARAVALRAERVKYLSNAQTQDD